MTTVKLGILGGAGRMGLAIARLAATMDDVALAAACDDPAHPAQGRDVGELAGIGACGVSIGADADAVFAHADAVVDFTAPAASARHAALAGIAKRAYVVGTTGLDADQEAAIAAAARSAPIVRAANMSVGVTLIATLVRAAARRLDPAWDIEIVEMHHRHKADAPSGTALALGQAAAAGRQQRLEDVAVRGRDGITGARAPGSIGFAALRGGDVAGEHRVIFAAAGERIEIGHIATSRDIFARGAIRAARWAHGRAPGLYDMNDVLGLD